MIEVPYVRDMVEQSEFDTIYHEHLCYFSVSALAAACSRATAWSCSAWSACRCTAARSRLFIGRGAGHGPTAEQLLQEEAALGRDDAGAYYAGFAARVERDRHRSASSLVSGLQPGGRDDRRLRRRGEGHASS